MYSLSVTSSLLPRSHTWLIVKQLSLSPLIFSIPVSFPIFPSIVVVQEWQVIPSMHSFRRDTPASAAWLGDKVGAFCLGLLGAWLSRNKLATTSLSCSKDVSEGTKVTLRPILSGFSLTSSTPWIWASFFKASCWAAGSRFGVGITWVSTGTAVTVVVSDSGESKPMSSMASDRDSGLCRVWSNMMVAFLLPKDT